MIKQLDRMRRMHNLIKFRRTGKPEAFAARLGISQSLLFRLLGELKKLGAPITYCQQRQTYTYYESVELQLGFVPVSESVQLPREDAPQRAKVIPLASAPTSGRKALSL